MVEYTVREGETCEEIALRLYGHRRHYITVAEHLGGVDSVLRSACDGALSPGRVIRLPRRARPESGGPDAKVTAVRRRVRSRAPGEQPDWAPAKVGQPLFQGWRVGTLERSTAELTFRDTSRVRLREHTLVIIYGASAGKARRTTSRAVLERGTLRSRLGELSGGPRLRVETPSARAELRGGEALVAVDGAETSRVANHSGGPAEVSTPDGRGRVKVHPGMGTSVRRGSRPSRPRPLPPAPSWEDEEPSLFVGLEELGAKVWGSWARVDGAVSYIVEVEGEGEERRIEAIRAPPSVHRFELQALPAGTYGVRVATVDARGFESRPSAPRAISVVELGLHPPARAVGQDVQILAGTRLTVPGSLTCSVDEARVDHPFPLLEPGRRSVRCRDREGDEAPPIALEVAPVSVSVSGFERGAPLELTQGERHTFFASLETEAPLLVDLEVSVEAGPGLEAEVTGWDSGQLDFALTATRGEPAHCFVDLVVPGEAGSARIARLSVEIVEAEAEGDDVPVEDDPQPETGPSEDEWGLAGSGLSLGPGLPHEGSSLLFQQGSFGVRDVRRRGTGAFLAAAYVGSRRGEPSDEPWVSGGIRAAFLDERLRFDIALGVGDDGRPGGLWTAASSLALAGEVLALAVEVGAWLPFGDGQHETGATRIAPSVDLAVTLGERVTLRSRQGALVEIESDGLALWSSAYAVDLWTVGPLGLGLEGMLLLGHDEGRIFVAPTTAIALSLSFGLVALSVVGRYGFTDDAARLLGQFVAFGAFRLTAFE
jgi:hypothetical protein